MSVCLFLDSIFGENGFQLFQPHVEFLFRETGLAVCEEAEGIGIVFLGEHPSLFCQLMEYFLGESMWRKRREKKEWRE